MHTKTWTTLGLLTLTALACSTGEATGVGSSEILYDDTCTKELCADLPRPDTDCTDTAPRFTCSAARDGQCAFSFTCPSKDDPGAAVSFSPCDDAECGTKPTTAAEAGCEAGKEFTGATCGRLNGSKTCAWASGCVALGPRIDIDESKVGAECGLDAATCPTGAQCVVLPLETGVRGAHCIDDPCSLLGCVDTCIMLDSYPGQVSCEE